MMGNGKEGFGTELGSRDGLMGPATREIGLWGEHMELDSSNIKAVTSTKENSDIAKLKETAHTSTCKGQYTQVNGKMTCRKVLVRKNGLMEAHIKDAT